MILAQELSETIQYLSSLASKEKKLASERASFQGPKLQKQKR